MAFSTTYKAIRDALRADVGTVFSLAASAVYTHNPGIEITTAHAILVPEPLRSSYDHQVASGKRPGMDIVINGEVLLANVDTVLDDAALVYADALCALLEAGATYGTYGMLPILSEFDLSELSGLNNGSGDARFFVRFQVRFMVQRDRG